MSFSRSANDVIYTINVCNTNSQTETYLSFRSTNLGEVLDKGSAYDVAVSYARFPATSIPLRKRFEDGILTVSMNIGNSTIGYTQPVIKMHRLIFLKVQNFRYYKLVAGLVKCFKV